jgi:predicted anti-sigma-YlaC factor YlaD
MKCFLIRDLLPFYAEGKVSSDTKDIIEKHFQECDKCRELYNSIKSCNEEIKAREVFPVDIKPQSKDREFWRKYYSSLYIRGICLFFAVLILVIEVIRLIRYFR